MPGYLEILDIYDNLEDIGPVTNHVKGEKNLW